MRLFRYFLIVALLAVGLVYGWQWFDKKGFPYSRSSSDFKISLKQKSTSPARRSIYAVDAGQIDGEAVLSYAPTKSVGQSMVSSQLAGIKSPFETMRAPYAGQITSHINCSAQKYLKEYELSFAGEDTHMVLAVASPRRVFGSCAVEQIKYASLFWTGYDDRRKQVVTVKLFKAIESLNEIDVAQKELTQAFYRLIGH
jgi:hypothetical protein